MKKIILILTLIFLVGCQTGPTVEFETTKIPVEVAQTSEQRGQGLMHRESLEGGMVFVFEDETQRSFWMKNTLIPLDMMFVGSDMTIREIKRDIQPCEADPCESYPSQYPAKYVVEVNAGFSDENGIKEGQKIELNIQ
jgi:uncharacterized membrane protein (UPF0127 family)